MTPVGSAATAEADWGQLVAAVAGAGRVLLVGHVNPDADALGSCLALASALRQRGVDVRVSFDAEPFAVPRALAWLPGAAEIMPTAEALAWGARADAVIALDCGAADRLGRLIGVAAAAPTFAVVDHHRSNTRFGHVNVVDPDSPATGVLVAELLERMGLSITDDVAINLYAAIASDTGSFRFSSTTAATHELAASLHRTGIPHAEVSRRLFASRPLHVARLAAAAVAGAQHLPDAAGGRGALVATVAIADRAAHGCNYDDVESIIADLATVGDVEVAALLKQDDAGRWKVSLRSKGAMDVGRLCADLGGGGHTQAAGYTADGEPEDVLAGLLDALARPDYAGS